MCEDTTNNKKDLSWKVDFVRRKMKESGFQLEDRAYSIFNEHLKDCEIEQNYHFSDWETSEDRELDLKITYSVADPPAFLDYVFLIECKQLPDSYWSFVRSRQQRMIFKNSFSIWDKVGRTGRHEKVVNMLDPTFKTKGMTCDTYSQSYKEFLPDGVKGSPDNVKSNNRTDNIRSSEIRLAKALYFENREALQQANIGRVWDGAADHIQVFWPMIIFQGNLFEANMQKEPPEIRSIGSAHLRHSSMQNKENIQMIVDIIEIDSLQQFIDKKIIPEIAEVKKKCETLWPSYETEVSSLRKQYTSGQIRYLKDPLQDLLSE